MRRLATAPLAALLLAGPLSASTTRGQSASALEAAGWRHAEWPGVPAARFRPLPGGGVAVRGEAQASFVWRPMRGTPGCLSWRWRVEEGPPATDLALRGGDDRALSIAVGFDGWPPGAGLWQRTRQSLAQARAGAGWRSGTGREPSFFASPYLAGLARVRVLRPADAVRGRWLAERADLAADWRAAFGGEPPPVQEIAVGTDVDDTGTRVDAAVEAPGLAPCG